MYNVLKPAAATIAAPAAQASRSYLIPLSPTHHSTHPPFLVAGEEAVLRLTRPVIALSANLGDDVLFP